ALWNVANRQRVDVLSKWPRGDRRFVSYLDQQPQLTELREAIDWLRDVPCNACQGVLRDLDKAWQRLFKGLADRPNFKRRWDSVGMIDPAFRATWVGDDWIRLPKLGRVHAVIHRPLAGSPKTCTVTRRGDHWFASICTEVQIPDPCVSRRAVVGIDRGVTSILADSDGRTVAPPDRLVRMAKLVDVAKAKADRKQKGSNNRAKAQRLVTQRQMKETDIRREFLHEESRYYAECYGVIVVEKLKIDNMTKSAKGTVEEPGRNVKAKAGLNRAILRSGWGQFVTMLCYKAEETGAIVVEVPAAYSSQTCSECGHVASENRNGKRFCCVSCGHEDDADINAARVLVQRYRNGEGAIIGGYNSKLKPKKTLRVTKGKKKTCAATPAVDARSFVKAGTQITGEAHVGTL
ncbi:unnamed protein product, partial [marine sediment metagenome]